MSGHAINLLPETSENRDTVQRALLEDLIFMEDHAYEMGDILRSKMYMMERATRISFVPPIIPQKVVEQLRPAFAKFEDLDEAMKLVYLQCATLASFVRVTIESIEAELVAQSALQVEQDRENSISMDMEEREAEAMEPGN